MESAVTSVETQTGTANQAQVMEVKQRYEDLKKLNLKLDMARGQPATEQFQISDNLWVNFNPKTDYIASDGTDCRNYPGGPYGLKEAREFFAPVIDCTADECIVGDSASLEMMQKTIVWALMRGVPGSERPWSKEAKVKFLCPVPGYDRHFTVCEALGIELIPVPMNESGPDMEAVQKLVATDASIKGMWSVPKYSNPTGITYSDSVVDALASMKTAAPDFRIFWDNAYAVHHFTDSPKPLKSILEACKVAGNPNRVIMFGSTSKITFSSAGVAYMGASKENIDYHAKLLGTQTISANKLNQHRHVQFLKAFEGGIPGIMKKHAQIMKPKFDAVQTIFERELGDSGLATWSKPEGGYFVSLDTRPGMATKVGQLAQEAGLTLTPVGATFPYKKDPEDRNIRIAPSRPPLEDVKQAMELLAVCIKMAAVG